MTRTPGNKAGGNQAAETVEVAGELARSGAWDAAYRRLAAVDDVATLDGDALEAFATCAYMCGREDDFVDLLSRAFDAFSAADAPMRAARTAFWIGLTLMFRGEMGRGGGWLSRCERLVDDHGGACAESGYVLLPQVEGALSAGDTAAAERLASQALEIGERHGDNDLAELARHLVGRARIAAGAMNEGLACLDETMLAATERRLAPIVTGLVYCSVIAVCQQYQIFRRAREWTLALSDWCDAQPEMVAFTGRCMIHRSEILILEGRWREAADEAGSACRRLTSGASGHRAGPAYYQEGEILRLNGRFDEADERYRAASRLGFDPQPGLALMRLSQGELTSAGAAIRRSLAAAGDVPARLRLLPAAVEIALAAGDTEAAEEYCGELAEFVQRYASDAAEAASAEARGDLHLARGDAGDALKD
ncbi:MAG TPA: helix-turn-helix transcriptional regulator [Afifellaceae bacterium]|nr:helix-turn-helix transcriptional regulator [Afifellaceae bacterium]